MEGRYNYNYQGGQGVITIIIKAVNIWTMDVTQSCLTMDNNGGLVRHCHHDGLTSHWQAMADHESSGSNLIKTVLLSADA